MSDLPGPSGERRPSERSISVLPSGLCRDFRDQPVTEQMDRLAALLKEHEDRMDLSDDRARALTESMRGVEADLADVARQYTKYCIKLNGPDIPQSNPGEDTCQVLWGLVGRKYGILLSHADRSQVMTAVLVFRVFSFFVFIFVFLADQIGASHRNRRNCSFLQYLD